MLTIQQLQQSNLTSPTRIDKWAALASSIEFTKSYRGENGWTDGNWGLVAMTGEFVRWTMGPRFNGSLEWVVGGLESQWATNRWTDNGGVSASL
jgi:hypothetical protein